MFMLIYSRDNRAPRFGEEDVDFGGANLKEPSPGVVAGLNRSGSLIMILFFEGLEQIVAYKKYNLILRKFL